LKHKKNKNPLSQKRVFTLLRGKGDQTFPYWFIITSFSFCLSRGNFVENFLFIIYLLFIKANQSKQNYFYTFS